MNTPAPSAGRAASGATAEQPDTAAAAAESGSPPILALKRATVRFARVGLPVWDGLSLSVSRGESLCLLGASGCGKSTVLRVMAGLQPLASGEMLTAVRSPAFVFQEPALLPWADLERNVGLPLQLAGWTAAARNERVQAVLERVGLTGRERALPHELSGGMKMRASIARALVMQPDLLLMDEPFSALDDPTRQRLQADLLQWWQVQGFALCFVTHQVAEAVFMASRVVVLGAKGGRIVAEWEVDEPFPRTDAFRRSARFHEHCVAIGDALAGNTGSTWDRR
ncbi:MAG: ABC transporter ATP-binding protein [Betaproteobacteria bacterium]